MNIVGGAGITTSGSGNTVTITATGAAGIQTLSANIGTASPDGSGNIQIAGVGNITTFASTSIVSIALTGLTNHAVQVGGTSNVLSQVSPGTAGFVLTSNGPSSDPSFESIGSSGVIITVTGSSGGAEVPDGSGNFNILGTGSITTVGSANTETVQLTGLTNHAVLVGAGTATITKIAATANTGAVLQNNSGADPSYSTATYPSTTTVSQLLYSSSTNVVAGLATANQAVLTTGATGIPVLTALATNGQIIIGSTSGVPAAATLTQGSGITITNGANSITIAVTNPSGFPWTDVTGATQTLAVNNGYITDHTNVTYTLPATGALGDTIKIVGKLGLATITPNANQQILIGSASGTVGATGTAVATNVGDCMTLICVTSGASTVYRAADFVGNWTLS